MAMPAIGMTSSPKGQKNLFQGCNSKLLIYTYSFQQLINFIKKLLFPCQKRAYAQKHKNI